MSKALENILLKSPERHMLDSDSTDLVNLEVPIATLVYERVSGGDLKIPVYPGKEIRIGRDDTKCEPAISNELVSKQHFHIYSIIYDQEQKTELQPLVYCEDLETTNGTYVNGQCIGMLGRERLGHLLVHDDVIEIKPHWKFRFLQPYKSNIHRDWSELTDLQYFEDQYAVSDRVLGKGHYGAVFLAKEISTSRQLACKIVNLKSAAQEITGNLRSEIPGRNWLDNVQRAREGRKLVMREINILSKLNHPNIIKLKKAFYSDASLYMFTELAPGGDLFSYIESHGGCLSDWHCRVIARQIVLAVQFMHSNGVVHRDLKPENVLIMQSDFGGRVVLTDFGFANYVHEKTGRLLSKLGTEGFIAPQVQTSSILQYMLTILREVEFVDIRNGGYTMAADLWSLGVLTACLLTGHSLIPREEMSQLSQEQIVDRFLEMDNSYIRNQWQYMSRRALKFLRGLLTTEPERRMTATQALNHSWLQKPATEAALIEEGYKRVIKFWKKRDDGDRVIEDLPGRKKILQEQPAQQAPGSRRKIPDTTLSPYFGLERYLQPREPPQRKNILNNLNKSGSFFLSSQEPRKVCPPKSSPTEKVLDVTIRSVPGHDLFGEYSENRTSQGILEMAEIQVVPRIVAECNEAHAMPVASHTSDAALERFLTSDDVLHTRSPSDDNNESNPKKRARIESEDPEERRVHDDISKMLPRYSSAKVFRDELKRRKLEKQKARNDAPS